MEEEEEEESATRPEERGPRAPTPIPVVALAAAAVPSSAPCGRWLSPREYIVCEGADDILRIDGGVEASHRLASVPRSLAPDPDPAPAPAPAPDPAHETSADEEDYIDDEWRL